MKKEKKDKKPLTKTPPEKLNSYLEQILTFIYKFRYLNSLQTQKLMNHKYHSNIYKWLNFLTENKYLKKYRESKFAAESAFYSLGTGGRKYFKEHPEIKDINHPLLDRVWSEKDNSKSFKNQCMFMAHIFISLLDLVKKVDNGQGKLHYFSQTDLQGVKYIIYPLPSAYFAIEDKDGVIKRYFIDVFYEYTRWKDMEKRVRQYLRYYDKQLWQIYMKHDFPEIILVCPKVISKNNLDEYIKERYKEKAFKINFYLSTKDEIKYQGMNPQVLHKVKLD